MTAYPIIDIRTVAVRIAAALLLALPALPAWAQLPPELRIPETTRILRLESHQSCEGCPAWFYELYADGTWHYEGIDAVYMLGENGTYKTYEARRRAALDVDMTSGNVEGKREIALRELRGYRNLVTNANDPERPLPRIRKAMLDSDFESWGSSFPQSLGRRSDGTETIFSIRIDIDGKSKFVRYLPSAAPPALAKLMNTILEVGHPFEFAQGRWVQRTPAFRGDPYAVLWTARMTRWKSYAVTLYRTDKATIYGWNDAGVVSRGFQVHSIQLEPGRVASLVEAISRASEVPTLGHEYSNPFRPAIVDAVFGPSYGVNRYILKGTNALPTGHAQRPLEELRDIVNSMLPLLGEDRPRPDGLRRIQ